MYSAPGLANCTHLVWTIRPGGFLSPAHWLASIIGAIRLTRESRRYHFALFAAYVAMLLVWNFPPEQRLILPVFPILLAGLARALAAFASLIRAAWRSRGRPTQFVAGAAVAHVL